MNKLDKKMMDKLIADKGRRFQVKVDNDIIFVIDKTIDENDENFDTRIVHEFYEYGWEFIIELMNYLGLDCEAV